jgi:deoxyuridine 5'-triphosphate nucleotidohydrolase
MKELSMFAKVVDDATIPVRGTPDSAGVDVFLYTEKLFVDGFLESGNPKYIRMEKIEPNETKLLRSGIRLKEPLPRGYYIQMSLRSSWRKKGLSSHGVGIIDGDYPDEIMHLVHNTTDKPIYIHNGERLSQFVVHAHHTQMLGCEIINKERTGGFGSTGK